MPKYQITAPDGRVVTIEGPRPPTQDDAAKIFARLPDVTATRAAGEPGRMSPVSRTGAEEKLPEQRGLGGLVADIALEGGGAAAGQAIGAMPVFSVPTYGLSIPAGGAIGGTLGNLGSQKRRILAGEQTGYRPGEAVASFFTGMVPGASLESSGAKAIAREGAKQALVGAGGRTLETLVDEGRLPSAPELALATALPAVGGALAQRMQAANPEIRAAVAEAEKVGATRRATLEAGREAGLVVPPSDVNPGFVNDLASSIGGKAALNQQANIKNQEVVNRLAKQALGIPENQDITEAGLREIRKDAAAPYEAIAAISPEAKKDLFDLRQARNDRTLETRHYQRSADPSALKKAEAAAERADELEAALELHATNAGRPELIGELRAAREKIAKTYDVENALNVADSNVSAASLGKALDRGKPLSGELETIGRFAEAFPSVMRERAKVPASGVSAFQGIGAVLAGLTGNAAFGPSGYLLAATPYARAPVRSLILSEPYQNFAAKIPLSVDARPPLRSVLARTTAQESAQEIADEVEPKKKK